RELRPALDEEVGRLPEKYRAPVVLCYLEGKTHEVAAAELGWPKGTVAGRLARARDLLRRRLERRGVTLSVAALTAAAVPDGLARHTLQAALAFAARRAAEPGAVSLQVAGLARGALRAMFLARLKGVAGFVLLLAVVSGAGALAFGGRAGEGPRRDAPQGGAGAGGKGDRPEPTAPVVKDVLAITVRPLKAVFGPDEAPRVEVTLKNVS